MEYNFYDTDNTKNTYEEFLKSDAQILILPVLGDGLPDRALETFGVYPKDLPLPPEIDITNGIDVRAINDKRDKWVLFIRLPDPAELTFAKVSHISENLAKKIYTTNTFRFNRIFTPVIGASQGVLPIVECCWIMITAFQDYEKTINKDHFHVLFLSTGPAFRLKMKESSAHQERRSAELAFLFSLEHIKNQDWLVQVQKAKGFYYETGQFALQDFVSHKAPNEKFYSDTLEYFKNSKMVFQVFLKHFAEESEEHKILVLCGTLVAYIDRNAYNKKIWNTYPDKRTLARSGVNQTQWTENLLRFKAAGNDPAAFSSSARNAFDMLDDPANHLTMLSERHRELVSTTLLGVPYQQDLFETQIIQYLNSLGISTANVLNRGVLASRILYTPEIKEIWLPDDASFSRRSPTRSDAQFFERLNTQIKPSEDELKVETEVIEPKAQLLRLMIHADSYADKDLLSYKTYAEVITAFLTSDLTKPPLTIGILAPWGKGKTSLMRFIEEKLKGYKKAADAEVVETPKMKYRELWGFLKKEAGEIFEIKTKDYPVVWFNAWKFQKNDQVWAGLAHEIITQLAAQLTEVEREKFWLRLNLKRIDKGKIRKDIVHKFINKLFFPILFCAAGIGIGLLIKLFQSPAIFWLAPVWSAMSTLGTGIWGWSEFQQIKDKPPEADISKYILQPEYRTKMGYYTEVEDDLRQALQLLSNKAKPPVIFIDDLDRCSPTRITELVEAINLFISGDINTCYFVIGLDAQIVSAALDATYKDVGAKTANLDKHHGSIGWYFMEKFLQLQFHLPALNKVQSTRILRHLLNNDGVLDEVEKKRRGALLSEYKDIEDTIATIDDFGLIFNLRKEEIEDDLMEFAPGRIEIFQQKVIARALSEYDVLQDELSAVIDEVAPYISASPRMIKRFANLFIFYRFIQYTECSRGLREAGTSTLGNWLLVMVRWPQLVRAIQWDTEKGLLFGEDPATRAEDFQQWVTGAETQSVWLSEVEYRVGKPSWQADRQLYEYFSKIAEPDLLKSAVLNGLW